MKRPGFFEGVALAFGLSLMGSLANGALGLFLPGNLVLPLVITGLSLAYLLYLLSRSRERVGRLIALAAWCVMAAAVWLWPLGLALYLLAHLGTLWLVRSLYFHGSVLAALGDLMLMGLGLIAALWAAAHTGSLFAGLWCFFLAQALFPSIRGPAPGGTAAAPEPADRFGQAHRAAEAALRRLSSIH
jgi:hypothetical protein